VRLFKPDKPIKKTDRELYGLLTTKILSGEYIFLKHAKLRQQDRQINDMDVLHILKGNVKRKRNKRKDSYDPGKQDWKYCVEGFDMDGLKIRVIITFEEAYLLVITVIRID
jgi:hypothetical protein